MAIKTTDWYRGVNDADLTLTTSVSSASSPSGSAVLKHNNQIHAVFAGSASGDELQITAPFKFNFLGLENTATAAVANATITAKNAGTAVGTVSSIADNTKYTAPTISQSARTVNAGSTVTLQCNSPGVQGIVVIDIDPA